MKLYWLAVLAAIFLALPTAGAIMQPDVMFIPDKPSVNSSFLMVADPHPYSGEAGVAVSWIIPGIENAYGSFPKVGSKWICYFSNTDTQSTCGYNRFPYPSTYTVLIDATAPGQVENTSVNAIIGGIPLSSKIDVTGNTVYVQAWVGGPISGSISYITYYVDTLEEVPDMSGTMAYNPNIFGYTKQMNLTKGDYFMAFTASSSTDFGGGVARFTVGGTGPCTGPGCVTQKVSAESIVYSATINAGQPFTLKRFKITNIGTENLTSLSISVQPELSSYLDIDPEKSSLQPNESTFMIVTLDNIQSSMNISTFATLFSGSTELYQIPVELRVSVIGSGTCAGKADGTDCLGGICCGEVCRKKANCCSNSDCETDQTCSSDFKCTTSVVPGECEGKNDMDACTGGICCSESCKAGGECCSSFDCTGTDEICENYICQPVTPGECELKSNMDPCTGGKCCSGYCVSGAQCCSDSDCDTAKGEICSTTSNICESVQPPPNGGIDVVTIALIGGGIAAAAVVGFFLFKKFRKKGGEEEELGSEEEEFSDEDFY